MFVDNRLLNICVKGFYLGLEIGLEAEAKTLEAEARTLEAEAEAEARTLEAEAEAEAGYFGLEAEARPRGLTSLLYMMMMMMMCDLPNGRFFYDIIGLLCRA